jgi:hypothetical protein
MTQLTDARDVLSTVSDQMADAVEGVGLAIVQVNGRPRRASSGVVTPRLRTSAPVATCSGLFTVSLANFALSDSTNP